ncbi:uncharacterized protein LOC116169539 [Photinus pyralis]|uniref:uncharacterized protein LOC116169539 n=1 Tax=Photinus pyralis TaxID=7054 RepID=UPI001267789A|nr:uncharacterized protein LOC116169539 [Photinus pyralis]
MGQHPSKDKLSYPPTIGKVSSRERFGSFAKRGSAKKRSEVVRVTQVLTASKLSPRSVHQNTLAENKKNVAKLSNDVKTPPRKILFTQKDKKPTSTVSTKGKCIKS